VHGRRRAACRRRRVTALICVSPRLLGEPFSDFLRGTRARTRATGEAVHDAFQSRIDGTDEFWAEHGRGESVGGGSGRVDRREAQRRAQRARGRVGVHVDGELAGVELDRAAFVELGRGNAANQQVLLYAERRVRVQVPDRGRDLQWEDAAAAAEDSFFVRAIAVVDALADNAYVRFAPVDRVERLAFERPPGPVDGKVGKRLRFGDGRGG